MSNIEPWMLARLAPHLQKAGEELASWLPASSESGLTIGTIIDGMATPETLVSAGGGTTIVAPFGGRMNGRMMIGLGAQLAERVRGGEAGTLDPTSVLEPVFTSVSDVLVELVGGQLRLAEISAAENEAAGFAWTGNGVVVGICIFDGDVHVATFAMEFQAALVVGEAPDNLDDESAFVPSNGTELATATQNVAAIEFQTLQATGSLGSQITRPLDLLHDVELQVTAELGRTQMTVRDLLSLAPGSVVELDRAAGSPIDVLVNGTLIARGEVVVIDEEFGIRIMEIVSADNPLAKRLS